MAKQNLIDKYLTGYAELQVNDLKSFDKHYHCSLIIPCFNEPIESIETIINNSNFEDNLLILALNQPLTTEQPYQLNHSNERLLEWLNNNFDRLWHSQTLTLFKNSYGMDILLVDSFSQTTSLPSEAGVGLARKIGNDIALTLIQSGNISTPWLFNY